MKLLILLALTLTGCSSLSEYRRGCQDGLRTYDNRLEVKQTQDFCKAVEKEDQIRQKEAKASKK